MADFGRLKICQIMLSAGFGGAERLFVDLCQALADREHRVLSICHPDFEKLPMLAHERIQVATLKVHLDWSLLAGFRLKKMLKHFRPQIIHCHLARSASIAGSAGFSLNIPVAANLHNYVKLKYYRKVGFFFPGTQDQRQHLMNNGISSDCIAVVPHFTRLQAAEKVNNFEKKPAVIISYGRFVRKKGFHLLLRAFKQVINRGIAARLILGGDGPEKSKLVNLISDLELEKYVTLYGWVDNLETFLSKGDIFILPSLDEPFGIVILEAMSQGKLILSSDARGPREILSHENAYLFPVENVEAMSKTIEVACRCGEKARQKAKKSLADFKLHYSEEQVLPVFENFYRHMIKARQNGTCLS